MSADTRLDRRGFLGLSGAAAVFAVGGPLAFAERAWGARSALKVGVLLPTGASYPRLGSSLFSGLKLALAGAIDATFSVRSVDRGYGGAYTGARALLDEGADVLVAGVSAPVATLIGDVAAARGHPLVVANAGGHVVGSDARNPYVLHNSLLLWQASFGAAEWAAHRLGKGALLAAARCEAGYETLNAFRRSFEAAGGTVLETVITHDSDDDGGVDALVAAVRRVQPDFVYACYSGAHAVEIVSGYGQAGMPARPRLVGSTFLTEDYLLPKLGRSGLGIVTAASWTASRRTPLNAAFDQSFRREAGRRPDPFAALGYDTGLLIVHGLARAERAGIGRHRLVEALGGTQIETPRGWISVDAATNTVRAPVRIRRVRRTPGGAANAELPWRRVIDQGAVQASGLSGSASGYVNEYLCA